MPREHIYDGWSGPLSGDKPSFDGRIAIIPYKPVYNPELSTIEKWTSKDKYIWVNPYIYSNFTLEYAYEDLEKEMYMLMGFYGRQVKYRDVADQMHMRDHKLGKMGDLLYVGNFLQALDLENHGEIVALGSTCKDAYGHYRVPKLTWWGEKKMLDVDYFLARWSGSTQFLGVTQV